MSRLSLSRQLEQTSGLDRILSLREEMRDRVLRKLQGCQLLSLETGSKVVDANRRLGDDDRLAGAAAGAHDLPSLQLTPPAVHQAIRSNV